MSNEKKSYKVTKQFTPGNGVVYEAGSSVELTEQEAKHFQKYLGCLDMESATIEEPSTIEG